MYLKILKIEKLIHKKIINIHFDCIICSEEFLLSQNRCHNYILVLIFFAKFIILMTVRTRFEKIKLFARYLGKYKKSLKINFDTIDVFLLLFLAKLIILITLQICFTFLYKSGTFDDCTDTIKTFFLASCCRHGSFFSANCVFFNLNLETPLGLWPRFARNYESVEVHRLEIKK